MATTPTYINQRINNLQSQINALQPYPPPETQTLSDVLANGNSAGTHSINMNNQNITAVNNIALTTINGSAYPPSIPTPPLSSVLAVNNSAGSNNINMNSQNITGVNNIALTTINGSAYPPAIPTPTINAVLGAGNISVDKTQVFTDSSTTQRMTLYSSQLLMNDTSNTISSTITNTQVTLDDGAGISCGLNNHSLSFDNPTYGTPIVLDGQYPSLNINDGLGNTTTTSQSGLVVIDNVTLNPNILQAQYAANGTNLVDTSTGLTSTMNASTLHIQNVYTDSFNSQSGSSIVCDTTLYMNNHDINQVNNINLVTINGMSPTTIGLTWADINDFNNAYTHLTNGGYGQNNYTGDVSVLGVNNLSIVNTTGGYAMNASATNFELNNNGQSGYFSIIGGIGSNTWGLDTGAGNAFVGDANGNSNVTRMIVNDSHKEIDFECADILNRYQGGVSSVICPNFTSIVNGGISYGGGNSFQNVFSQTFNIPDFYFTQSNGLFYWKLEFALNCRNMSNQDDKGLGIYIDIQDNASHTFQPYAFNQNTPFTTHKNTSTYHQTSNQSENYCWTDYIDLNGATGSPLTINLWWNADNALSCDFNWVLTMSKTTTY